MFKSNNGNKDTRKNFITKGFNRLICMWTGEKEKDYTKKMKNRLKRQQEFFYSFFDNDPSYEIYSQCYFKGNTRDFYCCQRRWIELSSYEANTKYTDDALRAYYSSEKVRNDMLKFKQYVESIKPDDDPGLAAEKGYHNYLYYFESDIENLYRKIDAVPNLETKIPSLNESSVCVFIERYCSTSDFHFIRDIPSAYKIYKSIQSSSLGEIKNPDEQMENDFDFVDRTIDTYINKNGSAAFASLLERFNKTLQSIKRKNKKLTLIRSTVRSNFPKEMFSGFDPDDPDYINNGDLESVIQNFRQITKLIDQTEAEIGGWND